MYTFSYLNTKFHITQFLLDIYSTIDLICHNKKKIQHFA